MKNKLISFFDLPESLPNLSTDQRDLYQTLHSALIYIPILLGFNFIGMVTIYMLGFTNLLDGSDWRLLLVGASSLIISALHLPLFSSLRQGKLESVTLGLLMINGMGAVAQVFLWKDILWLFLLLTAGPSIVFATQRGLRGTYRVISLLFGVFAAAGLLVADKNITYPRMSIDSLTQMAGLTIFLMAILIMVTLILFSSRIHFRTISARLVLTFTSVVGFSAITTLVIAALVGLSHDQRNMLRQLTAILNLRQAQIQAILTDLGEDMHRAADDGIMAQRMRFLISEPKDSPLYQFNNELVRAYLEKAQQGNTQYDEIFLLDAQGQVVITTLKADENANFGQSAFFQHARAEMTLTIEQDFPKTGVTSIVITHPILENEKLQGYLVARSSFDSIKDIMEAQTGLGDTLNTYIVGKDLTPLTNIHSSIARIATDATAQKTSDKETKGSGLYTNYDNVSVLGYYIWMPDIESTLIAEINRDEIMRGILNTLVTNLTISLFTIIVTFTIIYVTSRSISNPLVSLAEKATALAGGELSARITVTRQDEIGALASGFNTMAGELQHLVRTLEEKVEARTRDLQSQANRFRVAAEVARDATTARNLDELLNRSAQLVMERFNFYHTGIFLIDSRREFAILRASPTSAGLQMIENNHRLKIGQVGIVGNVAATGQPRIVLDTGQDMAYFNNPYLPNTRSEMALPLKVEGEVIGVLDVQSELPEAFTQEDIAILQIMADQLAISIRRVQLVQELEESLGEIKRTSQQFTLASWRSFSDTPDFKPGYRYDGAKLSPITSFPASSQEVLRRGQTVLLSDDGGNEKGARLAVPLKLRDQVIGVVNIRFNNAAVSQDTISLLEDAANRLAIALENARLYTETQKLAERERAASEIAARITTSSNIDNILRTTVLELGRMLPNSEITVQIQENKQ